MSCINIKSISISLVLILQLLNSPLRGQQLEVGGRNILHPATVTLKTGEFTGENVQYLILGDPEKPKPLIVFCSGSMPNPLLLKMPGDKFVPIGLPFNFYGYLEEFNFLLVSKPGIPLAAQQQELDQQFNYLDPSTREFPQEFLVRNHVDYYVSAFSAAFEHFRTLQLPAKQEKIILMGHSQGARVATKLASTLPQVTHLVYLSADPMGRYWEIIRRQVESPNLQASQLDSIYSVWADICSGAGDLAKGQPSEFKSTLSFSESLIDDLLALEIPVFLGYGTSDFSCATCGLVYFEAIRLGKTNILHRAYPRLDHNFFPLDPEGRPDYNAGKWDQVAEDVIRWVKDN